MARSECRGLGGPRSLWARVIIVYLPVRRGGLVCCRIDRSVRDRARRKRWGLCIIGLIRGILLRRRDSNRRRGVNWDRPVCHNPRQRSGRVRCCGAARFGRGVPRREGRAGNITWRSLRERGRCRGCWRQCLLSLLSTLAASYLDVVGRDETEVTLIADQNPVGISCVVDGELRIFGERELLVGLSRVFVQSAGVTRRGYLEHQKVSQSLLVT